LVEAAAAHSIGATFERQHTVVNVRLEPRKNGGVKLDELELGVALVWPVKFVGIRNLDGQVSGGRGCERLLCRSAVFGWRSLFCGKRFFPGFHASNSGIRAS
jgi:hypothetical protein